MGRTTRHFNNALWEKGDAPKKLRALLKEKNEKSFLKPQWAGSWWAEIGGMLSRMLAENFNADSKLEVIFPAGWIEVDWMRNSKSFNKLLNPQPLISDSDGNFPPIDDAEGLMIKPWIQDVKLWKQDTVWIKWSIDNITNNNIEWIHVTIKNMNTK